jgi:hypothetical protein
MHSAVLEFGSLRICPGRLSRFQGAMREHPTGQQPHTQDNATFSGMGSSILSNAFPQPTPSWCTGKRHERHSTYHRA